MRQRGSALIGVVLVTSAASAIALLAILGAGAAAGELHDRSAVLCARYAARGGSVLGVIADGRPQLVSPSVTALSVVIEERTADSCLIVATASCGQAVRTIARRLSGDSPACQGQ